MKHGASGDDPTTADLESPSPPPAAEVIFGDRLGLAERYRDILASDGITRGLIGPREVGRLWDRHIVNCAVIGEEIGDDLRVIDIGSGAGLPGIPLAIARPDLRITLIEPLLRRSSFLEETVRELGLSVEVLRGRAEEKSVRASVEPAEVVTSRAVAPLERLAQWSAPLIAVGGRLVAIKGSSAAEEIARDGDQVRALGVVDLTVATCGGVLIDPPTTVIVGRRVATSARGSKAARRSSPGQSSSHRRAGR